jgi:ABC-2 type transport system ATP-binding protein
LFLDEPTVGIDPVGARALRKIVKDLVALGKTILLTTHYMYEAEELCDRIAIINHGQMVELDTPANLKRRVSGETVIDVQVKQDGRLLEDRLQHLTDCLSLHTTQHDSHEQVSIRTQQPSVVMETLAPLLQQRLIEGLEVRNPTLEDVYVNIIQQASDQA